MISEDPQRTASSRTVFAIAAAVALVTASVHFALVGETEASVRQVVRASARTSASLFFLYFATPAAAHLRRQIGVFRVLADWRSFALLFATSQLAHLLALVAWALLYPESFFADFALLPVVGGAILYLFTLHIARKAWRPQEPEQGVSPAAEALGHYALWLTFSLAYWLRLQEGWLFAVLSVLSLLSMAAHLVAAILVQRPRHVA